jgi:hypothetical protein
VLSVGREWIPSGAVSRRQDLFEFAEDGAPEAPKHVVAS